MERTDLPQADNGSKDGSGAADHDEPYRFGRRPRAESPWPFTERQFAKLLVLRGRLSDQPNPADQVAPRLLTVLPRQADVNKKSRKRAA